MGLFDKINSMLVKPKDDAYDNDVENENDYVDALDEEPPVRVREPMDISGHGTAGTVELKVVRPETYASVTEIADHLLNRCTVVLNLEATNKEVAKRLIDFLAGVAYSINGQLKNVSNNTYIVTPCNVDVADDQVRNVEIRHQEEAAAPIQSASPFTSDTLF